MNWIEILLIAAGISLDIFGAVACLGALVAKINGKRLTLFCIMYAVWQTGALYIGSFLAYLLCTYDLKDHPVRTGRIISATIFIILGARMLWKTFKEGGIIEKREDTISLLAALRILIYATFYTVLTGVGFGFLTTRLSVALPMVAIATAIAVAVGFFTGYRLGFEQKNKAYFISSLCMMAGGVDVIIRYVL